MSKLALELVQFYVARVDVYRSLTAADYGFLLSALASVARSSCLPLLAETLRRVRVRRDFEAGYALYDHPRSCSFLERLSLWQLQRMSADELPAPATFRDLVHDVCEAMNDAWEYIWDFGVEPKRAECLLRADYQLFLAWVAAVARLHVVVALGEAPPDAAECLRSYDTCTTLMRAPVYHADL
jgi:hypothetical protein